jgi:hypothetical protein
VPHQLPALLNEPGPSARDMRDTSQIRKMLIWGIPLFMGLSIASFWMIHPMIVRPIEQIGALAPAIRVVPGSLVFPFVGVFAALAVVIAILRAIPYDGKPLQTLEKAFNLTVLASFIALALVATTSTLLQDRYLPELGYSRCELLQGSPTLWFTDWVRNPDWCVRGKTLEWVDEQAQSAAPRGG